jgi:hypothetical protein
MRYTAILLSAVLAPVAIAQALSGINAPVNRTVTLALDEATFTITVAAGLDSTTQQVKQALQNAGLPNPTVVATGLGQNASNRIALSTDAAILYSATLAIPAGSAMETAKGLEALRTQPPSLVVSLEYSVAYNPSQATVDAARQNVLPLLLEDSRKLAQSLAAASGVKVGAIRSISDSGGATGGYSFGSILLGVPTIAARIGDFSGLVTQFPLSGPRSSTQYTFYLSVVFAAQ